MRRGRSAEHEGRMQLAPNALDFVWGVLFVLAFVKTGSGRQ